MRSLLLLGVVLALASCTTRPSKVQGAPKVAPDEQYEVGGSFAHRFLIWNCYEGSRVAMIQSCSPHSCNDWRLHRGPCGAPTAAEKDALGDSGVSDRQEIPEGSRWH